MCRTNSEIRLRYRRVGNQKTQGVVDDDNWRIWIKLLSLRIEQILIGKEHIEIRKID